MRNLIQLIKRYYNFFIFIILQIVCWVLVFSNNTYQQASYINSSRNIAGKFYANKNKFLGFLSLGATNDSLARENARLRSLLGIKVSKNPLKDTTYTTVHVKDSMRTTIDYTYIPAKVLNNTLDQKRNYITLDKGSEDGIKTGMAVISDKGIVGRVSHVNNHYSVVNSILSDKLPVSAQAPDGTIGIISWQGSDPETVELSKIPQSIKVKKGDSILTSTYSFYPENILIGRVKRKDKATCQVTLSTNFRNLHYVYIVNDVTKIERFLFEDSVKHAENP